VRINYEAAVFASERTVLPWERQMQQSVDYKQMAVRFTMLAATGGVTRGRI